MTYAKKSTDPRAARPTTVGTTLSLSTELQYLCCRQTTHPKLAQTQQLPLFTLNTLAEPEAASLFSVLTVPVVLLFANGKEVHREARIIDFTRLTQQILRYQEALTSVEEQDSYESLFDQLDE